MIARPVVLGSLFFLTACSHLANPHPKPLPQDPDIQVYFNQNPAKGANYQEPYRKIPRPGDNLEQIIIDTVHNAKTSVDIAVQELRLPNLAQELVNLQQRGIQVRIILENHYSRPLSELTASQIDRLDERDRRGYQDYFTFADRNRDRQLSAAEIGRSDALVMLKNAGIPIIDDTDDGSKGSGLMHHGHCHFRQFYLQRCSRRFHQPPKSRQCQSPPQNSKSPTCRSLHPRI
jgi:hypothetical protein